MSNDATKPNIIGNSPTLQRAVENAKRVALTTAPVVIRGESGTGKELFARLIHNESQRSGLFVPVNCSALPEALVESVLFGHRRGAFTGATDSSSGLIAGADGGTLFLDEIGELPLTVQAKLLRVLQQRAVLSVGEIRERPVDLRIVAASHRDLKQLVSEGRFREDLYFRLVCYELDIPPLRERGQDVIVIARTLLSSHQCLHGAEKRSLTRNAEQLLVRHAWPGNVRELENVLFRASLSSKGNVITAKDISGIIGISTTRDSEPLAQRALEQVRTSGEISCLDLASAVGASRSTLKRLLKALVEAGDLASIGVGKATLYRLPVTTDVYTDIRQKTAVKLVESKGRITRQDLAEVCTISTRTAGRVLAGMVHAGLLIPDGGKGRIAGYISVPS